jgi:hypothetical protein
MIHPARLGTGRLEAAALVVLALALFLVPILHGPHVAPIGRAAIEGAALDGLAADCTACKWIAHATALAAPAPLEVLRDPAPCAACPAPAGTALAPADLSHDHPARAPPSLLA